MENVTQLKEVLDLIYNNSSSPDTYSGLTTHSSLRLFYNEMLSQATIFRYTHKNGDDVVIDTLAIFDPENLAYTGGVYNGKIMRNQNISGTNLLSYKVGLGSYVNYKTFIRNVCVFLGVSMSEDFDSKNPGIYNDLVDICKKYFNMNNNCPYFWQKYTTDSYKSFVPVLCLVDIAIYLNELGLFVKPALVRKPLVGTIDNDYFSASDNDYFSASDFNNQFLTKEEFIKIYSIYAGDNAKTLIEKLLEVYVDEIDFSNSIIITTLYNLGSVINLYVTDLTTKFTWKHIDNFNTYNYLNNPDENYVLYRYTINSELNTYKVVIEKAAGVVANLGNYEIFTNFKLNYVVAYNSSSYADSNNIMSPLNNNIHYNKVNTLKSLYLFSPNAYYNSYSFSGFFNHSHCNILAYRKINVGDNDLVYCFNYSTSEGSSLVNHLVFVAFRDIKGVTFRNFPNYLLKSRGSNFSYYLRKNTSNEIEKYDCISSEYLSNIDISSMSIEFDEDTYCDVFNYKEIGGVYDFYSETQQVLSDSYNFASILGVNRVNIYGNNIGKEAKMVINETSIEGLTLIPNANYPNTIVDYTSFINKYNSVIRQTMRNPYFIQGEMQDVLNGYEWIDCTVTKTPPTTQSDAQNSTLDNLTTDEVDDIIKDINNASDDKDNKDDDTPPNDNKVTEGIEGPGTEYPDLDEIGDPCSAGVNGFIKLYKLSKAEFEAFSSEITSSNFWDALVSLPFSILGDPFKKIISLQVGYFWDTTHVTNNQAIKFGIVETHVTADILNRSNFDYDIGELEVNRLYNNYLDYIAIGMTLYLPYVGFVDINPVTFISRVIKLHARINNLSGVITYYVSVKESLNSANEYLINTFEGKCQQEIPINETSQSAALRGIAGITAGAAVAASGAAIGGAVASSVSQVAGGIGTVLENKGRSSYDNTLKSFEEGNGNISSLIKGRMSREGFYSAANKAYDISDKASNFNGSKPAKAIGGAVATKGLMNPPVFGGNFNTSSNPLINPVIASLYTYAKADYNPSKIGEFYGNPSNSYTLLGNVKGYTVVKDIHLDIKCTSTERDKIEQLLKGGVIL